MKSHSPHIVFLMGKKLDSGSMERVRKSCGYVNGIDISTDGSRGGLSMAWNGNHLVDIRSYSKNHIDAVINDVDSDAKWRLTGFYGNPVARDRSQSWDLIRSLHDGCNFPWLICGDFNEILYSHGKVGRIPRDDCCMEQFRRILQDCDLVDEGYSSPWFTWERGNLPEINIRE